MLRLNNQLTRIKKSLKTVFLIAIRLHASIVFTFFNFPLSSVGLFKSSLISFVSARTISEDWSSSGDSKNEDEDKERRSPRDKESKDKDTECM